METTFSMPRAYAMRAKAASAAGGRSREPLHGQQELLGLFEAAEPRLSGYLMSSLKLAHRRTTSMIGITAPSVPDHCGYKRKDRVVVVLDGPCAGP